jgi:hypothetical protein
MPCHVQEPDFVVLSPDPEEDFVCFPNLPLGRRIPDWGANGSKSEEEARETCNKYSSRHPSRTPGIFCLFCPHGFSLGFALMQRQEGVSTFFNILYCRLPEAPKMVIYDNGCNLHVYAVARAPSFFRDTAFVVDKFHMPGHIA